jgi:hypothetical protein
MFVKGRYLSPCIPGGGEKKFPLEFSEYPVFSLISRSEY